MTDLYKLVETPLDRAVDQAIAAENDRYLALPQEVRDEEAERQLRSWQGHTILRFGFKLGAQLDQAAADRLAKYRQENAS